MQAIGFVDRLRALRHRRGLRGFVFNVAGNVLPMAVAIVAMPVLARLAGLERLGVLGLAWTLVGYLGLLDLGLSRIVVRRVAAATTELGLGQEAALVGRLCRLLAASVSLVALGVGALLTAHVQTATWRGALTPAELVPAIWLLMASLPMVVITGVLRGVLEGQMRFGTANALKIGLGVWSFGVPMLVAFWQPQLPFLIGALVVGRALGLLLHWRAVAPFLAVRNAPATPIAPLLREGGWLTVSNVVGPLMVSFDRFAIGALVSLAAVAWYLVPQEVALRLLALPIAVATTVFPMVARARAGGALQATQRLTARSLQATVVLSLLPALLFAGLAEPLLEAWMGAEFARASAPAAAVLAVGLYVNCVAQVPFATLQAAGRADVTGRVHLIEVPLYAVLLLALLERWGVAGAALAWSARTVVDGVVMLVLAARLRLMRISSTEVAVLAVGLLLVVLAALAAALLPVSARAAIVTGAGVAALAMSLWLARGLLADQGPGQ